MEMAAAARPELLDLEAAGESGNHWPAAQVPRRKKLLRRAKRICRR